MRIEARECHVAYSPAFPHEPDVKVQDSGGMCECSNGMTLHRYSMLIDFVEEGFAEG